MLTVFIMDNSVTTQQLQSINHGVTATIITCTADLYENVNSKKCKRKSLFVTSKKYDK